MTLGCIIQARMGSGRLPGKVMLKVDDNLTILEYVVSQVNKSKLVEKIVIATTSLKEDDKRVDLAKVLESIIFAETPMMF